MNIVIAVRCYNEEKHIRRFLKGYEFADHIVISDGGSTDRSVEIIENYPKSYPKIHLLNYSHQETVNGETWNEDAGHMNFVLDAAKELKPTWLLFDDMDDVPNWLLRDNARYLLSGLEDTPHVQVNAFRLYLWGDTGSYFPYMNRNFNPDYTSIWGWRADRVDILADMHTRHGTLLGLSPNPYKIDPPFCLLHKSWYPETIDAKVERYNKLGLPMNHPFEFAGNPTKLPEWAEE